jgi:hypothetical protein
MIGTTFLRRALLTALLLTVGSYGARQVSYRFGSQFSVARIMPPIEERQVAELLPDGERERIRAILDQEFRYLGQGGQSFVFESADGRYVLKFVKQVPHYPWRWHDCRVFLWGPGEQEEREANSYRKQVESVYKSWRLADQKARNNTGLVMVHLDRTDGWLGQTRVVDKWGNSHLVQMDQVPFMIQKRADSLDRTLRQLFRNRQFQKARALLDQMVELVVEDKNQGVCDHDFSMRNTGILDGKLIHMDVGTMEPLEENQGDLTYRLTQWLEQNRQPQLARYLKERLENR